MSLAHDYVERAKRAFAEDLLRAGQLGWVYRMCHSSQIAPSNAYADFFRAMGLLEVPLAVNYASWGATTVVSGELRVSCEPGEIWGGLVVAASLLLSDPPEEMRAVATVLLAEGRVEVVR